jgi:two-component system LytT family response regulator
VDDEPLARRRLEALLQDEPDVEVVGEAEDGPSAVAAIRKHSPDLVLLDVQMPGMSGFDVIAELGPERCPAVVFATAHDRYALRAFEVHALDYLLKPFDRRRLRQALSRARRDAADPAELGRRLLALVSEARGGAPLKRLTVKSRGRIYFVRADEIDWIEAAGHYLTLHVGQQTHLLRDTIKRLGSRLDPSRFVRVHRGTIVNVDRVRELLPSFHGEYVIVLRDGTRIESSRGYSGRLQELLRS